MPPSRLFARWQQVCMPPSRLFARWQQVCMPPSRLFARWQQVCMPPSRLFARWQQVCTPPSRLFARWQQVCMPPSRLFARWQQVCMPPSLLCTDLATYSLGVSPRSTGSNESTHRLVCILLGCYIALIIRSRRISFQMVSKETFTCYSNCFCRES